MRLECRRANAQQSSVVRMLLDSLMGSPGNSVRQSFRLNHSGGTLIIWHAEHHGVLAEDSPGVNTPGSRAQAQMPMRTM
jgi:hypothetical protein